MSKATNFYVDPVSGGSTKDGLSWANAVADISTAITKAATAPYDVTVDNIFVKQGTMTFTVAKSYTSIDNIYGSCVGTETSPEQRPLTDLDGNGVVETWEFQYPTIFSSSYAGSALSLTLTNSTFNGFTITHTASATTSVRAISCNSSATIFENNIVKNCALTAGMLATSSINSVVMRAYGLMKNCLFEKNQVTLNASYDGSFSFIEMIGSSKISGCVFRNNNITMNHSAASTGNIRGIILNVIVSTGSNPAVLSNCLVYNNELNYVPSGSAPAKTSSCATICLSSFSTTSATTDSLINCTIANNKTTNMKSAGLYVYYNNPTAPSVPVNHYVINNLFWNNHNDGIKSNLNLTTSSPLCGLVANNLMQGGNTTALASNSTYIMNNNVSLDSINGATNGPNFMNPTTIIGNTVDLTAEKSIWSIQSGSYALNKGVVTSILLDKAGLAFGTTPAVGAYSSSNALSTSSKIVVSDPNLITILKDGVKINENGTLQLFSFKGDKILEQKVTKGQIVKLPKGTYIIQFLSTNKTSSVNKVII